MKKIYVVDNDPSMCQLMAMAFRQGGHEIVACTTPDIAQEALQNGKCAALLMDYHLGVGESGAGLVTGWARHLDLPPTWIVTGTPEADDLQAVKNVPGFVDVIAKPFAILELVKAVVSTLPSAAVQNHESEMEAES